jgi:hypothetical protein
MRPTRKLVVISNMRRIFFPFVFCGLVMSSGSARTAADAMNAVAERYTHLVLALGQHDPDYVDEFYGPAEWKIQAEGPHPAPLVPLYHPGA